MKKIQFFQFAICTVLTLFVAATISAQDTKILPPTDPKTTGDQTLNPGSGPTTGGGATIVQSGMDDKTAGRNANSNDIKSAELACKVCENVKKGQTLTVQEEQVLKALKSVQSDVTKVCAQTCDLSARIRSYRLSPAEVKLVDAVRAAADIK